MLAGGGLKTGQVIGRSNDDLKAPAVAERLISVRDFMATVCMALGINYKKDFTYQDRPLRVVDKDANPVMELF